MNDDHVYQVYNGQEGDEATRILTRMRVHWILDHTPPGRILDIGCSQGVISFLLAQRGDEVTGLDNERPAIEFAEGVRSELDPKVGERIEFVEGDALELPFEAKAYDHVVCGELLEHVDDPARAVEEAFRVLAPHGALIATVPLGILPHPDHRREFYPDSLTALVNPLFEVEKVSVLERHIGIVGQRRTRARQKPSYRLSRAELAFLEHERDLHKQLKSVEGNLLKANLKYRQATESAGATRERLADAQSSLETAERELSAREEAVEELRTQASELRGRGDADRDRLERKIAELTEDRREERRRVGARRARRRTRMRERRGRLHEAVTRQDEAIDEIEGRVSEVRAGLEPTQSSIVDPKSDLVTPCRPTRALHPVEDDEFERWRRRAAAAPGNDVVFMYSGTIHVQEKRGNRPIRLTREYLERGQPVFFNYWRWKKDEPPPEWEHPLLFQSPVDITPTLIDRLLEADFGGKRKLMFASFPHELMIRALSRAAQCGWVTIYDARDDWEEFQKVGMAKWYDPGFEEHLIRHADLVTAVSSPLARKLIAMGDREDIHVVPNGLDSKFPDPPGPRQPSEPPAVGYFGHLTPKWFDWDLVLRAARQHPDWRFELAGHQAPDDLSLPANVTLLGLLGHAELADLSRGWSFAIIPFKVSALGEAVDPIKVYEYLHLGLPVLSSYMPQMREYPGTFVSESREDFLALLPAMTEQDLDHATVRSWLEANTWEVRVKRYGELADRVRLDRHPATVGDLLRGGA